MTANEEYLLDNQQAEAGQRFDALSALFNPSTFRHAQAVGLTTGWRVWEVGAGSPGVPTWLAGQVGAATDTEIEQHLRNVATGRLDLATSPEDSACGRKPAATGPPS